MSLRRGDVSWEDFLKAAPLHGSFQAHVADASDVTNILFSSGTTGEPPKCHLRLPLSCSTNTPFSLTLLVMTLLRSTQLRGHGLAGEPKAIPWTHVTPIRCGVDGWAQQDVRRGDVVAWPTNLGWMMGPWLLYAALLNVAAVALFQVYDCRLFMFKSDFARVAGFTVHPSSSTCIQLLQQHVLCVKL